MHLMSIHNICFEQKMILSFHIEPILEHIEKKNCGNKFTEIVWISYIWLPSYWITNARKIMRRKKEANTKQITETLQFSEKHYGYSLIVIENLMKTT